MFEVRRRILSPIKSGMRFLWMSSLDVIDSITGSRPPLTPPRVLSWSIGGNFDGAGKHFFGLFKSLAKLRPEDRVLDVGCGVGRMAVPLTGYLRSGGRYEGFDIMENVVSWCSTNITPRFPEFRFRWVQIYNKQYNPGATVKARNFRFPYEDGCFDFVFATSVFTHMFEDDIENYMKEIHRVLAPGGRCLLSWFVLTPVAKEKMAAGQAALNFIYPVQTGFTAFAKMPEAAIAFTEQTVLALYARSGLPEPQFFPGNWSSAHATESYQDLYLATKSGT